MLYVAAAILVWAFGLARMWDYRMLEWNRVDTAWQLELVWLARHGSFSGRDFDYARGPLWQVIATLPTALFRSPSAATILAGMEAGFFALGAVIAGWVGLRRIRAGWPRIAGFLVLTGLSFGVGVSTFRALLSTAVVLSLVDRRPSFRGALAPAALATACGTSTAAIGLRSSFWSVVISSTDTVPPSSSITVSRSRIRWER